ncbi:MAG: WhiB family transcriptional regulator [Candidatus Micrarchaeaceae archaeon]
MFFPYDARDPRVEIAKAICGGCVVREACLDYALSRREGSGTWGGMSEWERRRYLKTIRLEA